MIEATAYCKVYQKRLYKKQKPMCRIQCWNVIEKKSPNAFDKNVQGEGKTVFWTDFAPKQLKRGIFGMCAKFYVISMYI